VVDEKQQAFELRLSKLEQALKTAKVVNVAVGLVMAKYLMNQEDALDVLKQAARTQKRKLVEVAQEQIRAHPIQ
jgi:AmiR/NasT family two-component response regulator